MKRVTLACVLLAVFGTGAFPSSPQRLRVLTYNIHHGEGTDGRFDLDRQAGLMMSVEPDLIAIQEIDRGTARANGEDQLATFERLTGLYGAFAKTLDFQGGGYGVAVLSRLPVLRTERHPLPGSPDREPRVGLTVDVALGPEGTRLRFTSTHLDQGRDLTSRVAQASYLNDLFSADDTTPSVLAGDMNSQSDTEVMQILSSGWTDMFLAPGPQAPPGLSRRRVDHVLVRPGPSWRLIDSQVIDDRLASDHRPVLVELEWTGN